MSNQTADVIVIGGGVHGCSTAFHLAQRGLQVLLLEKQFIGAGATGRSSGLVRMHYDTETDSRLAWVSFQYFRQWKDMVGGECGFTRTGFVQIVAAEHVEQLRLNTALHQSIGIPTLLVTAADLQRLVPGMRVDDVEWAAFEPESGYAMPSDTTNTLLQAARNRGARLIQNCPVTALTTAGGRITGVSTPQGSFSAPVVVNAAGAWAASLHAPLGITIPYDTWRHDVMFVRRPAHLFAHHPTVIDFPNLMYFRPEGDLTLVGLEDANPMGMSPDSDADHAAPGFAERAIDRLCRRLPGMDAGALHSAHSGYDGITPDQRALLGAIGPDGYYLNCGHSGTGFKIAPAVGLCLAELVVDGAATTVDISALSPQRFAEGRPIRGNYENLWS